MQKKVLTMQEMSCTCTCGSSAGNGKGKLVMPNHPGQREQTVHYLSPVFSNLGALILAENK